MYRLFVDSSNGVDVYPEYDMTDASRKVEARHRTRAGAEYVYTFGEYTQIKFSVKYVNSSFRAIVNSWWASNTDLLWMEEGGTEVYSVRLMNKALPVGKVIKPYSDKFQGTIELGTY